MKVQVRDLVDNKQMLSHIFFECLSKEELIKIKEKYIGPDETAKDWRSESVTIPVDLKIGGISVNPKAFFDQWQNQMEAMILKAAKELVAEQIGSNKLRALQSRFQQLELILESFEEDINWETINPFNENK